LDVQVIWPNAWTAESGWLARHLDLEVSTLPMDSDRLIDANGRLARPRGCIRVTRDLSLHLLFGILGVGWLYSLHHGTRPSESGMLL
jgi:hypothetical protein